MPFSPTGVFTPPDGSENAFPGQVIRSAVWNATFTDIADALTLLGRQLLHSTLVTTTPHVPLLSESLLLVNVAGPVAINMPLAADRIDGAVGFPIVIKDTSGVAHTNNITIVPSGAETIEGLASIIISVDYGAFRLFPVTGGWVILP